MDSRFKYWICAINDTNWQIVKNLKIWGVQQTHINKIKKVNPGDFFIFYVVKNGLGGIFKVTSSFFKEEKSIFKGGLYPYRIKLEPVKILDKPANFKKLVSKLIFIKNKKYWTSYFRHTMVTINEVDFNTIKSSL
jgi:predicted RNA-binding protein